MTHFSPGNFRRKWKWKIGTRQYLHDCDNVSRCNDDEGAELRCVVFFPSVGGTLFYKFRSVPRFG